MTNPLFNLVFGPVFGWLTLMSVLVVAYLGRLELRERRRNRRMEEKRELLSRGPRIRSQKPRRLAIRAMTEAARLETNCTTTVRDFHKVDRQTPWNLRPANLN